MLAVLLLCNCKNNEPKQDNSRATAVSQLSPEDSTIYEFARFLRKKEDSICPIIHTLNTDSYHVVDTKKFDSIIRAFWGSQYDLSTVPFKKIDLKTIQNTMTSAKCYDEYIGFISDSTKKDVDINLKKLDTFTLKEPCYSKPLFRSLEKKLRLNSATNFEFTKGKNNNRYVIIFKVKDVKGTPYYYDITNWPTFINMIENK